MATAEKNRPSYFTLLELEVLMHIFGEYYPIFFKKSHTVAAAKEREAAWKKIAAQVNA